MSETPAPPDGLSLEDWKDVERAVDAARSQDAYAGRHYRAVGAAAPAMFQEECAEHWATLLTRVRAEIARREP